MAVARARARRMGSSGWLEIRRRLYRDHPNYGWMKTKETIRTDGEDLRERVYGIHFGPSPDAAAYRLG